MWVGVFFEGLRKRRGPDCETTTRYLFSIFNGGGGYGPRLQLFLIAPDRASSAVWDRVNLRSSSLSITSGMVG